MIEIKREYFGGESRTEKEFTNIKTEINKEYFGGVKVETEEWSKTVVAQAIVLAIVTDLPAGPLAYGAADAGIPSLVWVGAKGAVHIEVSDDLGAIVDDVNLPAGSTSYKLAGYNDWNPAKYHIIVTDSATPTPSSVQSGEIEIGSVPVVEVQPQAATINEGGSATLSVTAVGGDLTYQWKKGAANVVDGANFIGSKTATLQIQNAPTSAAGNYKCVVTNSKGNVDSAVAAVVVNALPAIVFDQDFPSNYSLADPVPVLKWSGSVAPFSVKLENGMAEVETVTVQDGAVGYTPTKAKLTAGMSVTAVVRGENGTGAEFRSVTMAITA